MNKAFILIALAITMLEANSLNDPNPNRIDTNDSIQGRNQPTGEHHRQLLSANTRLLVSYFKTHLRGYPEGKVDVTSNSQQWEFWEWIYIGNNKFYWKSYHGTYLRANPNGSVDLAKSPQAWETWEKIPGNGYNVWKSYHGTYLRANPNGKVDLAPNALEWERWSELTPNDSTPNIPKDSTQPVSQDSNFGPVSGRNIIIKNNCDFPIWPGLYGIISATGQSFFGKAGSSNPAGFKLDSKQQKTIPIPAGIGGARVWARTGCSYQTNPNWPEPKTRFICESGECGNGANLWDGTCYGSSGNGANTLAEFTVDQSGLWWYDISLVDGFTLPVTMTPIGSPVKVSTPNPKFSCGAPSCRPSYNLCPPEVLKRNANGTPAGCFSISKAINDADLRSKTAALNSYFSNPVTRSHTECSCGVGSCAGGTVAEVLSNIRNGPRNVIGEDTTGFCCSPVNPMYQTAGISNHICYATDKPMPLSNFGNGKRYDQIFKSICPDAYSWEFDDENSTYLCKGDNLSVGITFC